MRLGTVAPLSVPRGKNGSDVTLRGYTIPNLTYVFANTWAIHRDPKTWKSPEEFDPENFLDDEGEVFIPPEFMPFSTGKL